MLNVAIVDDKKANSTTLQEIIGLYCPSLTVTGIANTLDDAYALLMQTKPDLLFLDIEMPPGSGFDLLKKFNPVPFEVVFITAYNQYALQAFRENALDYLLKPIDISLLQHTVQKAEHLIAMKQVNTNLVRYLQTLQTPPTTKISLPVFDGYLFVDYHKITHCEGSGSYSIFYMDNGEKLMVSMRLKECEQALPAKLFIRVHHSHIVNLQYISKYVRGRGGYVHMNDGTTIEVSAGKKETFLSGMKMRF